MAGSFGYEKEHYDLSESRAAKVVRSEDKRRKALYQKLGKTDYDDPYLLARSFALAASRAIDVQPVGVVYPNFRDSEGFEAECRRDRRSGFIGKIAIHPAQAEIANRAFTPSDDEVAHARRVIQAFDDNPGVGTIGLDGMMLDMPHLKQARNTVALAEEIARRDG